MKKSFIAVFLLTINISAYAKIIPYPNEITDCVALSNHDVHIILDWKINTIHINGITDHQIAKAVKYGKEYGKAITSENFLNTEGTLTYFTIFETFDGDYIYINNAVTNQIMYSSKLKCKNENQYLSESITSKYHKKKHVYQIQAGDTIYRTKNGDSLAEIAERFHVSTRAIRLANSMFNHKLKNNITIVIPTHEQYGK